MSCFFVFDMSVLWYAHYTLCQAWVMLLVWSCCVASDQVVKALLSTTYYWEDATGSERLNTLSLKKYILWTFFVLVILHFISHIFTSSIECVLLWDGQRSVTLLLTGSVMFLLTGSVMLLLVPIDIAHVQYRRPSKLYKKKSRKYTKHTRQVVVLCRRTSN